jgi:hypothetical protein
VRDNRTVGAWTFTDADGLSAQLSDGRRQVAGASVYPRSESIRSWSLCSGKVQQPARLLPTVSDCHQPREQPRSPSRPSCHEFASRGSPGGVPDGAVISR